MEKAEKKIEKRFSEQELAMKRTTLPLHSFLDSAELSVYYILDRMPVRNAAGIGDRRTVRTIAKVAGMTTECAQRAIESLVSLGLVQEPGRDTTMTGSAIRFSDVYELCRKLGDYPVGFGKYLRRLSGNTMASRIQPKLFVEAMGNMMKEEEV